MCTRVRIYRICCWLGPLLGQVAALRGASCRCPTAQQLVNFLRACRNSAAAALRVVTDADQPNGEVLIDTIHVARSATTLDDLRGIPATRMSYLQICDCPASPAESVEDLLFTARQERLLPGEGGADLAGIVGALPADLIVSVEIPSHRRIADMGHAAWAEFCLAESRRAMADFDAKRQP